MAIVKKVYAEDFKKITRLLLEFNFRLTEKDWRQLFLNHWKSEEDYFGYALIDNNNVVGFLGLIFSNRMINNKMQKFCNLTTWIVKEGYRSESLLLFLPLLGLKEYTITDFTPSKNVYSILKRFGFKDIETNINIIPPVPAINPLSNKCYVEFDKDKIKNYLSEKDLKIYHDHLGFKNAYLLISSKEGNCYIVVNRTRKKFFYFGKIHYVSNLDVFLKYINRVIFKICSRLNVCGLIIDGQCIGKNKIKHLITIKRRRPAAFKSNSLDVNDIDTLYSELLVLNL